MEGVFWLNEREGEVYQLVGRQVEKKKQMKVINSVLMIHKHLSQFDAPSDSSRFIFPPDRVKREQKKHKSRTHLRARDLIIQAVSLPRKPGFEFDGSL